MFGAMSILCPRGHMISFTRRDSLSEFHIRDFTIVVGIKDYTQVCAYAIGSCAFNDMSNTHAPHWLVRAWTHPLGTYNIFIQDVQL